jgi:hypothetical protein
MSEGRRQQQASDARALELWKEAGQLGSSQANNQLGIYYQLQRDKDFNASWKYIKQAADQGNPSGLASAAAIIVSVKASDGFQRTVLNVITCSVIIVMMLSRKYQRLGDLVAGTIVVVEERQWLTGVAKLDDPRAIQLAAYLPPNFVVSRSLAKVLATYVERRRFFTPPRRREVARHLAIPLLDRFGLPPDTSYDLLLCALYYRTFIADRSDDERLLAEAQAAFTASNPFAYVQPGLPVGQAASLP